MKNGLLLLSFIISIIGVNAQQDLQFTHFKEYALFYNPAYAGVSNDICGDILGRNQWTGFGGNPKSLFFDVRYSDAKLHGGVGLTVVSDELGFRKTTSVSASYSYKKSFPSIGTLYLGASIGFSRAGWKGNFIPPETLSDPNIPFSGQAANVFNSNVGLYYTKRNLFMGLSTTNVNQGVFDGGGVSQFNFNTVRHYYVLAGYKTMLTRGVDLEPSLLAKSDGVSTQIDMKAKVIFNNQMFGGINYRFGDAISPIVGMYIPGNNFRLTVSYSYDITTSDIRNYSSGSHEIAISFCKKIAKPVERHDDPRDLGGRQ